jgi:CRP-like cAMP-binding protein
MNLETKHQPEPMAVRVALHPFLAGMDRKHLSLLTDCAVPTEFKPGDVILREGELATRVYLLETGRVNLEARVRGHEPVVIDTIGAGDLLGWSCMFPPYAWHFTARAVERTRAIFFCGEILRKYCQRDRLLGYEVLKRMMPVMIKRMQRARENLVAVNAGLTSLGPVLIESPFLAGKVDITTTTLADIPFREGAD